MAPGTTTRRLAIFLVVAAGGLSLDLWTKDYMFRRLGPPSPQGRTEWVIPGYFGWQTSLNEGALFGMGQGLTSLFAAAAAAAGAGIFYWLFVVGAAADRLLNFALAGVMGGVLGNLYDRLGWWWTRDFEGYPRHAVRDWILLQYGRWVWPNFNVADMLLVGGAGLLMFHAWRMPAAEQPSTSGERPPVV